MCDQSNCLRRSQWGECVHVFTLQDDPNSSCFLLHWDLSLQSAAASCYFLPCLLLYSIVTSFRISPQHHPPSSICYNQNKPRLLHLLPRCTLLNLNPTEYFQHVRKDLTETNLCYFLYMCGRILQKQLNWYFLCKTIDLDSSTCSDEALQLPDQLSWLANNTTRGSRFQPIILYALRSTAFQLEEHVQLCLQFLCFTSQLKLD